MADIVETVETSELITRNRYVVARAKNVSTNDTITLSDYTSILGSAIFQDDGTSVTHTKATNIITVTQSSLTNVHMWVFAIVY